MTESFHPMQLMAPVFWGGLMFALLQVFRAAPERPGEGFGFSALVLVSWLSIFSFLSGFSIGLFLAIINVALGTILALLAKHYQIQIVFATFTSFLLVLFMLDFFIAGRFLLEMLLLAALIYSIWYLYKFRARRHGTSFAGALLAVEALLFFLSLLLQKDTVVLVFLTISAVVFGLFSTFIAKHYRIYLAIVTSASVIWAASVYLQLRFDG